MSTHFKLVIESVEGMSMIDTIQKEVYYYARNHYGEPPELISIDRDQHIQLLADRQSHMYLNPMDERCIMGINFEVRYE